MHTANARLSYQVALAHYRSRRGLDRVTWVTWLLVIGTCALWGYTAYQAALAAGAHTWRGVLEHIQANAISIQAGDDAALTQGLIAYGAKYNPAIIEQHEYWRFLTPMFLHANALHLAINMLNLLMLGVFLERLLGHMRYLLIYLIAGIVSVVASFYFAPEEVSIGASGAIFGLVGVFSVFIITHRRAFPAGGLFSILFLIVIIGINLGVGFVIPNVDNYAHLGGLLSGCLLGWFFSPLYRRQSTYTVVDCHSLARRWPLALLTILGTLILTIISLYLIGAKA
ncbi:rhomboid family intramembrane serine protease [Ktedonospora formicarum]|uniref:rhomboid family intramembrane serine protease n=1 Tax=Ktedonospora formicarum TaxID=2778364 RepID=UPI001C691345|nr:rhomboid family intramembrane serine protease [Ktedonospora formicarum]